MWISSQSQSDLQSLRVGQSMGAPLMEIRALPCCDNRRKNHLKARRSSIWMCQSIIYFNQNLCIVLNVYCYCMILIWGFKKMDLIINGISPSVSVSYCCQSVNEPVNHQKNSCASAVSWAYPAWWLFFIHPHALHLDGEAVISWRPPQNDSMGDDLIRFGVDDWWFIDDRIRIDQLINQWQSKIRN